MCGQRQTHTQSLKKGQKKEQRKHLLHPAPNLLLYSSHSFTFGTLPSDRDRSLKFPIPSHFPTRAPCFAQFSGVALDEPLDPQLEELAADRHVHLVERVLFCRRGRRSSDEKEVK